MIDFQFLLDKIDRHRSITNLLLFFETLSNNGVRKTCCTPIGKIFE